MFVFRDVLLQLSDFKNESTVIFKMTPVRVHSSSRWSGPPKAIVLQVDRVTELHWGRGLPGEPEFLKWIRWDCGTFEGTFSKIMVSAMTNMIFETTGIHIQY